VSGQEFVRKNGNFTLSILAPRAIGLPYGTIPRLLISWLTTEAVRTHQRELVLGDNLSDFMRQLGMVPTGGRWGTIGRLREQTSRLFASSITAIYRDKAGISIHKQDVVSDANLWWDPKSPEQGSLWESNVVLGEQFFKEIMKNPVPVDMRALRALKKSPMALDIYTWLTYRMTRVRGPTVISWEGLQMQFGAGYATDAQGLRNFRKFFLEALQRVVVVYPQAKVSQEEGGLELRPSPPHIARKP
jgi:hypothetical protein